MTGLWESIFLLLALISLIWGFSKKSAVFIYYFILFFFIFFFNFLLLKFYIGYIAFFNLPLWFLRLLGITVTGLFLYYPASRIGLLGRRLFFILDVSFLKNWLNALIVLATYILLFNCVYAFIYLLAADCGQENIISYLLVVKKSKLLNQFLFLSSYIISF